MKVYGRQLVAGGYIKSASRWQQLCDHGISSSSDVSNAALLSPSLSCMSASLTPTMCWRRRRRMRRFARHAATQHTPETVAANPTDTRTETKQWENIPHSSHLYAHRYKLWRSAVHYRKFLVCRTHDTST